VHPFPRSQFLSYLKYEIVENTEQERKMTKIVLVAHRNLDLVDIAYLRQECQNQNLAFFNYWYSYRKKRLQIHFEQVCITHLVELAAGEQLCRRCTHRKVYHFKTFRRFSWKITNFELWHCCSVLWYNSGMHMLKLTRWWILRIIFLCNFLCSKTNNKYVLQHLMDTVRKKIFYLLFFNVCLKTLLFLGGLI